MIAVHSELILLHCHVYETNAVGIAACDIMTTEAFITVLPCLLPPPQSS